MFHIGLLSSTDCEEDRMGDVIPIETAISTARSATAKSTGSRVDEINVPPGSIPQGIGYLQ
jgi:hypothetical protein